MVTDRIVGCLLVAAACVAAALFALPAMPHSASAQQGWVIRSFDAIYVIDESGSVTVTEDILVDFGSQQRHGIFRDVPVEYAYEDDFNRLIDIGNVSVDDGEQPRRLDSLSRQGPNLRIKIGDPSVTVSGEQRYRITYTFDDGLNAFDDHDELFWNVTGNDWQATIERATATVVAPGPGIQMVTCFQGPRGSTDPCTSSDDGTSASFSATRPLPPGAGLTIVVGLEKGLVQVGPPVLVEAHIDRLEKAADFFGLGPVSIAISAFVTAVVAGVLFRQWWLVGRDRWFGDAYYDTQNPRPERMPPFFHETIVVEYQPPELQGDGRRLRPAEVGLLLDERADTLDVSATIVDLAVRKYLRIEELAKEGVFGGLDYELTRLEKSVEELLPYERELLDALFGGESTVKMSELRGEFHEDLAKVKEELYKQGVSANRFFSRDPEKVRSQYQLSGLGVAAAGGIAIGILGAALGVGLIGTPIVIGGVFLFLSASTMPRRTARGRQMYRRCLGFRTYMTAGDQDRQRFAEEANIFEEYLPYAIVFKSARKWAATFEALGLQKTEVGWYVSPRGFVPLHLATSVRVFSSSVSTVMASTPGGSGASGFSGGGFSGGFSGGGGGGGGGGAW